MRTTMFYPECAKAITAVDLSFVNAGVVLLVDKKDSQHHFLESTDTHQAPKKQSPGLLDQTITRE